MPPPEINKYHFGTIQIDGKSFIKDIIILPDKVISGWRERLVICLRQLIWKAY